MTKTLTYELTISSGAADIEAELEVNFDFDSGIRGPSILRIAETQTKLDPCRVYAMLGGFDRACEVLGEIWESEVAA